MEVIERKDIRDLAYTEGPEKLSENKRLTSVETLIPRNKQTERLYGVSKWLSSFTIQLALDPLICHFPESRRNSTARRYAFQRQKLVVVRSIWSSN